MQRAVRLPPQHVLPVLTLLAQLCCHLRLKGQSAEGQCVAGSVPVSSCPSHGCHHFETDSSGDSGETTCQNAEAVTRRLTHDALGPVPPSGRASVVGRACLPHWVLLPAHWVLFPAHWVLLPVGCCLRRKGREAPSCPGRGPACRAPSAVGFLAPRVTVCTWGLQASEGRSSRTGVRPAPAQALPTPGTSSPAV